MTEGSPSCLKREKRYLSRKKKLYSCPLSSRRGDGRAPYLVKLGLGTDERRAIVVGPCVVVGVGFVLHHAVRLRASAATVVGRRHRVRPSLAKTQRENEGGLLSAAQKPTADERTSGQSALQLFTDSVKDASPPLSARQAIVRHGSDGDGHSLPTACTVPLWTHDTLL